MKTFWERTKIFFHYLKWAYKRWTGPRVYVVQYAYTDKDGVQRYDSHVVRGISFDVRNIVAYLTQQVEGKNSLIIMGITEVPCAIYNASLVDNAELFVQRVDKIADEFKPVQSEPVRTEEEEDDGTKDATDMLG